MKNSKTTYSKILPIFKGEENRPIWMQKPFYINNLAISTDAHSLVYFDKNLCNDLKPCERENPEQIVSVIPVQLDDYYEVFGTINRQELQKAFADKQIYEPSKCKACQGTGYAVYEFSYGSETYTKDDIECPVCDGDGNEDKLGNYYVDIGLSKFKVKEIDKLISTAKLLDQNEIELIFHQAQHSKSVFKIKDVLILVMPSNYDIQNDKVKMEMKENTIAKFLEEKTKTHTFKVS